MDDGVKSRDEGFLYRLFEGVDTDLVASVSDFKVFVAGLSTDYLKRLSFRIAARSFPVLAKVDNQEHLKRVLLNGFRCVLVMHRGSDGSAQTSALKLLELTKPDFSYNGGQAAHHAAQAIERVSRNALSPSDAVNALNEYIAAVADSGHNQISHIRSEEDILIAVNNDCYLISIDQGRRLTQVPLWDNTGQKSLWHLYENNDLEVCLKGLGPSWSLIFRWYQQISSDATYNPFEIKVLTEIACMSDDFWGHGNDNPRTSDDVIADIAKRLGWPVAAPNIVESQVTTTSPDAQLVATTIAKK